MLISEPHLRVIGDVLHPRRHYSQRFTYFVFKAPFVSLVFKWGVTEKLVTFPQSHTVGAGAGLWTLIVSEPKGSN